MDQRQDAETNLLTISGGLDVRDPSDGEIRASPRFVPVPADPGPRSIGPPAGGRGTAGGPRGSRRRPGPGLSLGQRSDRHPRVTRAPGAKRPERVAWDGVPRGWRGAEGQRKGKCS